MNNILSGTQQLRAARKQHTFGKLIARHANGQETREYILSGGTVQIKAWPTEHNIAPLPEPALCETPHYADERANAALGFKRK